MPVNSGLFDVLDIYKKLPGLPQISMNVGRTAPYVELVDVGIYRVVTYVSVLQATPEAGMENNV